MAGYELDSIFGPTPAPAEDDLAAKLLAHLGLAQPQAPAVRTAAPASPAQPRADAAPAPFSLAPVSPGLPAQPQAPAMERVPTVDTMPTRDAPAEPMYERSPGAVLSALGRGYSSGGLIGAIGDAIQVGTANDPRNQNYRFLTGRGIDDQTARAAVEDPRIFQGLLVQIFAKPAQGTADQRNYAFYAADAERRGEAPMSFNDWTFQSRKAGATTVNVGPGGADFGKPPAGTVWKRNPETREIEIDERGAPVAIPVQGSKAYNESQEEANRQGSKTFEADTKDGMLLSTIGEIEATLSGGGLSGFFATGLPSVLASAIPGTSAYDFARQIDTVKANIGFDRLQAMREASPTGGALGNVTERELAFLQSVAGSLDQAQSTDEFSRNLQQIKAMISSRRERYLAAYREDVERFGRAAADRALRLSGIEPPGAQGAVKAAPPDVLDQARQAIERGADRAAVLKRLGERGYSAEGL